MLVVGITITQMKYNDLILCLFANSNFPAWWRMTPISVQWSLQFSLESIITPRYLKAWLKKSSSRLNALLLYLQKTTSPALVRHMLHAKHGDVIRHIIVEELLSHLIERRVSRMSVSFAT